jgi:membrane-bound lytic murein transglycosylase MltF
MAPHRSRRPRALVPRLLVIAALLDTACAGGEKPAAPAAGESASSPVAQARSDDKSAAAEAPLPEVASPYDVLPPNVRAVIGERFTGDLDEMVKRRIVRAGVTFNRTHYFIDKGEQRGMAYESLRSFEEQINKTIKTGNLTVHVVFVPLARADLLTALTDGRVDMVAAQLTVTPERRQLVDFSIPVRSQVSEIVVTGPGAPALSSPDDLSGQAVFVRPSSSYHASLVALNGRLKAAGKAPVTITDAPGALEDDDILEMVNAGLVPITVVDDYLAEFWQQVFPSARAHQEIALRTGGEIAVAVRKGNPKLKAAGDDWIRKNGLGTAFGNVVNKRYLQNTGYAATATSEAERRKFRALVELFQKYSGQYDLDFLLMAAQGYQESRLDQGAKSRVGAIGVMQVMPKTGAELGVGDIKQIEPNVHAGVKYIRQLIDKHLNDPAIDPVNKGLMAFAAYNAGPGRLRQLRDLAEQRGLNKNVWFGNVERMASERIGRETVQYVSNIFKYYVAYKLVLEQQETRAGLKKTSGS